MPGSKKSFILLLVAIMLCVFVLPAFAGSSISETQQELKDVQKDIQSRKEELSQNKKEQTRLLREIDNLKKEIALLEGEISSLNKKISTTEDEIAETEAKLRAAEEKVAQLEELLAVRLRVIHKHGDVSFLEVLLSSTSFIDFLTRYNDLQQLIDKDKTLLEECQQERDNIVALKETLEEQRQELLALRRETLNKKQEVEKKRTERQNLVAVLQADYEETNRQIEKLEDEAKKLTELIKRLQAAQSGTASRGTGTLIWPVEDYGRGWITSHYGYRTDPISGRKGSFHGGLDIGIPHSRWPKSRSYIGNPVRILAADSGTAYTYPMNGGYGNLVIIDHHNGISTVYAHCDSFLVKSGQAVVQGQAIAIVGSTGISTGPHLHFEVRVNGERVNPLGYLR